MLKEVNNFIILEINSYDNYKVIVSKSNHIE